MLGRTDGPSDSDSGGRVILFEDRPQELEARGVVSAVPFFVRLEGKRTRAQPCIHFGSRCTSGRRKGEGEKRGSVERDSECDLFFSVFMASLRAGGVGRHIEGEPCVKKGSERVQ